MTASVDRCTSPASSAITNTSSIDQRPIASTITYRRVRVRGFQRQRCRTDRHSTARMPSLASGTKKLAMNTMMARCHEPDVHR